MTLLQHVQAFCKRLSQPKGRGLSLVEIAVSLTVCGVIAAMLMPLVVGSRLGHESDSMRRAVLAESIRVLASIQQKGMVSDELSPANLLTYILQNSKTLKKCPNNAVTEGCWTPSATEDPAITNETSEGGFILANGAVIAGLNNCCDYGNDLWANAFAIDWNGKKPPNRLGEDQLMMFICFGSGRCDMPGLSTRIEAGQIKPWGTYYNPSDPSYQLYRSLGE